MDTSFTGQMKMMVKETNDWHNVFPCEDWTLEDYKRLFWFIEKEILIQSNENSGFIFNEYHKDFEDNIEIFKSDD